MKPIYQYHFMLFRLLVYLHDRTKASSLHLHCFVRLLDQKPACSELVPFSISPSHLCFCYCVRVSSKSSLMSATGCLQYTCVGGGPKRLRNKANEYLPHLAVFENDSSDSQSVESASKNSNEICTKVHNEIHCPRCTAFVKRALSRPERY